MVRLPTTLPQLISRSLPLGSTHCLAQDKQKANTGVYGRYIVRSVADLFVASVLQGRVNSPIWTLPLVLANTVLLGHPQSLVTRSKKRQCIRTGSIRMQYIVTQLK